MKHLVAVTAVVLLGGLGALGQLGFGVPYASGRAEESDKLWTPAEAGVVFADACSGCHLPPDSRFATDRAWIHQLKDTA